MNARARGGMVVLERMVGPVSTVLESLARDRSANDHRGMRTVRHTILGAVAVVAATVIAPTASAASPNTTQVPCKAPDFFIFQDTGANQKCYAYGGDPVYPDFPNVACHLLTWSGIQEWQEHRAVWFRQVGGVGVVQCLPGQP